MLLDDGTTVNANNLPVWECLPYNAHGLFVQIGLIVGRHQYGTVHHKIVGVGRRQTVSIVIDRTGETTR